MDNVNSIFIEKPLPDIIAYDLKVLFIGYNPGILSSTIRHHYAHKSNRFWRLLYESGLTPYRFDTSEDRKLLEFNFGSTNIIDRPSKSADEIETSELKKGAQNLFGLIKELKPQIACYVGIGVYKAFASNILDIPVSKVSINMGKQKTGIVNGTIDFVCSNSSGLNTIPYNEQLGCFRELKNLTVELSK
jgi:TDG/mug DNA glycosylase family protein